MASWSHIVQNLSRSICHAAKLAKEAIASVEEIVIMHETPGDLPCLLPPLQTVS